MPLKDRELDDYYQNLFSMTASKGWQGLMEDLKKLETAYADIRHAASPEQFHVNLGRLDIVDYLLRYKEFNVAAYDRLLEQEAEE